MSKKSASTLERWMNKPSFKKRFAEEHEEFLISELVLAVMADDAQSVRDIARAIGISKTVIQNLRSGTQRDMKLSNFVKLSHACGYSLVLEKGDNRIQI